MNIPCYSIKQPYTTPGQIVI